MARGWKTECSGLRWPLWAIVGGSTSVLRLEVYAWLQSDPEAAPGRSHCGSLHCRVGSAQAGPGECRAGCSGCRSPPTARSLHSSRGVLPRVQQGEGLRQLVHSSGLQLSQRPGLRLRRRRRLRLRCTRSERPVSQTSNVQSGIAAIRARTPACTAAPASRTRKCLPAAELNSSYFVLLHAAPPGPLSPVRPRDRRFVIPIRRLICGDRTAEHRAPPSAPHGLASLPCEALECIEWSAPTRPR